MALSKLNHDTNGVHHECLAETVPPGRARLLVVEDEEDIREMLSFSLRTHNFSIQVAVDGRSAWQELMNNAYDLILLDWMLPDITGIELLQRIRNEERLKDIRVIMLTARSEESDRIRGLETGADDYVVKPFSLNELRARIRSRLRYREESSRDMLCTDGVVLNQASYRTSIDGRHVELSPTEFRLLRHFMRTPDRVFSRTQLLDAVWGTNVYIDERTVDVHIRRLRKALEPYERAHLVQTVRGTGYRFSSRD
ncbi:MAG: phosphate regulon transcriptional regulator PhoB [Gammaproteobacteria bacterium]|jgi:two-component system phosphate regulon response regulator PhoB